MGSLKTSINFRSPLISLALLLGAGCLHGCATAPSDQPDATSASSAGLAYAQVIETSRGGDNDSSEAALLAFLDKYPNVAEAHASLGMLYARTERDEQAAASLALALQHDPELAAALNEMGMLHRRAGRFEQAREAYLKALSINPDHANAHRNLGVLYDLYLGEPALALPHYEQYRRLLQVDDPMVAKWVTDLKRRIDQDMKTARVTN